MAVSPDVIYMESASVCAGLAACTDLQSRRIPNWLTGSGILAGLAVHLALGGALVTAALGRRLRETFTNAFAVLAHHQKHGLVSHPELNAGNPKLLRLPYALPIAGSCLAALLMHLHGGPAL